MKRGLFLTFCLLLLCACLTAQADVTPIIQDDADLLTDEEEQALMEVMAPICEYGTPMFWTTNESGNDRNLAANFYERKIGRGDGTVVVINMKKNDSTKVQTVVQTIADADDNIYADVEQMPEYPGGMGAMYKVLYQNVRYPAAVQDHGIQGTVIVNFVVEKDGTLSGVKATEVRDVNTGAVLPEVKVIAFSRDDRQKARRQGQLTDEFKDKAKANQHYADGIKVLKAESERLVRLLPERWKPGRNAGQPVRVSVTLPVTFKLQ